jgi:hypothetical protein
MDWMYNNPTGAAGINRDGVTGSTLRVISSEVGFESHISVTKKKIS